MILLIRRIGFYILAALVAITLDFFIPRMMPGNAVAAALANLRSQFTPATIKALELQYGVGTNQSLWSQYVHYWDKLLHGDMGLSTSHYPATVMSVISAGLPWTLGLVGLATVISFTLGTLLGILVAWRRGTFLDNLLPAMTFFQAAPYFFDRAGDRVLDQTGLVPGHQRLRPDPRDSGLELGLHQQRALPCLPARPDHRAGLRGRVDRRHAQRHGHHHGRGLRARRPGQGTAQAPRHELRGA